MKHNVQEAISGLMAICNSTKIQCHVQFEALYTQTASVLTIQQSHSLRDDGDSQPNKGEKLQHVVVA